MKTRLLKPKMWAALFAIAVLGLLLWPHIHQVLAVAAVQNSLQRAWEINFGSGNTPPGLPVSVDSAVDDLLGRIFANTGGYDGTQPAPTRNRHIIHHSSEEFNLACALRQPISSFVNLFTFLLLPAALFGVPSTVIAILLPIHLFLQFWYHTRYIGKLGFLEKFMVTPSHHRVHHAINPEYMDRNHGQIFIFWDKWFGTFQEELDSVPPVFGITRPAHTWNPE